MSKMSWFDMRISDGSSRRKSWESCTIGCRYLKIKGPSWAVRIHIRTVRSGHRLSCPTSQGSKTCTNGNTTKRMEDHCYSITSMPSWRSRYTSAANLFQVYFVWFADPAGTAVEHLQCLSTFFCNLIDFLLLFSMLFRRGSWYRTMIG